MSNQIKATKTGCLIARVHIHIITEAAQKLKFAISHCDLARDEDYVVDNRIGYVVCGRRCYTRKFDPLFSKAGVDDTWNLSISLIEVSGIKS